MAVVPWWVVLSSTCAPVVLVGGWAYATTLQPPGYDPILDSISALAARGAADPWIMSSALYLLGVCYMATGYGLRASAMAGRVVLVAGGAASILVGLSPEPTGGATSLRHLVSAGIGFTLLALFPVLAAGRGHAPNWTLRPATGRIVTVLMAGGAAWFLVELHGHGVAGLAERILTAAQTLWPLVIVLACSADRLGAVLGRTPVPAAAVEGRDGDGAGEPEGYQG